MRLEIYKKLESIFEKPSVPSDKALKSLAGIYAVSIITKNPIPALITIPYVAAKSIKKEKKIDEYLDNTITPAVCILTSVIFIYKFETLDVITSKGFPLITKLF